VVGWVGTRRILIGDMWHAWMFQRKDKIDGVSIVSTRAVDLASVGGPYFELDNERFIVLKEKSLGRSGAD